MLLTQLLIGEFSKQFTKNGHNFWFLLSTFFVLKPEKIFYLAQIGTMELVIFEDFEPHAITLQPVFTEICELPLASSVAITF